jgi:pimeloyl-ACP methyl ester carboxylesterase
MAGRVARALKWTVLSGLSLLTIGVAFLVYAVASFDTETLPDDYGRVGSVLYAGDKENQPLIVGLGGAEGGNTWVRPQYKPIRDAFLGDGYAFLALAYFGGRDSAKELDRISVEGVHAAIMEAARDPRINENCIAVIGGSKGAELALLLASHYPDIKAVVGVVPGHSVFPAHTIAMNTPSFALNGEPLPFVPVPMSAVPALIKRDLRGVYDAMLTDQDAVERAAIAVENINGPVLLLSATRDQFWPSTEMSELIVERLRRNDFPFAVKHVAVEGDHESPQERIDLVEAFLRQNILLESESGCSRYKH